MICVSGALLLLVPSKPEQAAGLSNYQLFLLAFCMLNTVFGYGCFAAALKHWQATRVSATLAIVPIFTIALMKLGHMLFPAIVETENLNPLSLIGALSVVAGAMVCALKLPSLKTLKK